jgi:hypothetical protein
MRRALIASALLLTGCTINGVTAEYEHVSHPLAGPPFGPRTEEDSLNVANLVIDMKTQSPRICVQHVLGYKLSDGGFYGPRVTYELRAGIKLWSRE